MDTIRLILMGGIVAGLIASHVGAYRMGRSAERTAALTRSVEVLRERGKTNETVKNMDDPALCAQLGGVWRNATCE